MMKQHQEEKEDVGEMDTEEEAEEERCEDYFSQEESPQGRDTEQ